MEFVEEVQEAEMEIRKAKLEEAGEVSTLAGELFPLACPPGMPEEDMQAYIAENLSEARFVEYITSADSLVTVAEGDGQLLGYTLVFLDDKAVPPPEFGVTLPSGVLLSKLYVRPELHGQGVSLALLDEVKGEARALGYGGVWLNTNNVNHRAARFYEKHGFEHVGFVNFKAGGSTFRDPVFQFAF